MIWHNVSIEKLRIIGSGWIVLIPKMSIMTSRCSTTMSRGAIRLLKLRDTQVVELLPDFHIFCTVLEGHLYHQGSILSLSSSRPAKITLPPSAYFHYNPGQIKGQPRKGKNQVRNAGFHQIIQQIQSNQNQKWGDNKRIRTYQQRPKRDVSQCKIMLLLWSGYH